MNILSQSYTSFLVNDLLGMSSIVPFLLEKNEQTKITLISFIYKKEVIDHLYICAHIDEYRLNYMFISYSSKD